MQCPQSWQRDDQLQERTKMMKRVLRLSALLALSALASCASASGGGKDPSGCDAGAQKAISAADLNQVQLCIQSKTKTHSFIVEVAETSQQQAKGMMFRTELADDRGMLFPFVEVRMASFWMKNTVIPLDIIFVRADGVIENIGENAEPYSTAHVESTAPVAAVLELRGGLAAEMGIEAGDKVEWK
jgi:uncharacterized membrane protein (UPF0127 family)/predicted small secreted protein